MDYLHHFLVGQMVFTVPLVTMFNTVLFIYATAQVTDGIIFAVRGAYNEFFPIHLGIFSPDIGSYSPITSNTFSNYPVGSSGKFFQ